MVKSKCGAGFVVKDGRCVQKDTFYVGNTSIFDTPPYYHSEKIAKIVRKAGGQRVRLANEYGWTNQPQVVVFKAKSEREAKEIGDRVSEEIFRGETGFKKGKHVIIYEKDW
jgi:hypothetical protein